MKITEREAIRAIVLTPEREVLLMRIRAPDRSEWFWIAPGGGLEPGETPETGLRRELREELGLEGFALGPLVWRRQHTFNWGEKRYRQREHFYIVPVARFEPLMSDAVEKERLDQFRWWPVAELGRASEPISPLSLGEIVTSYLVQGPPSEVPKMEMLVD